MSVETVSLSNFFVATNFSSLVNNALLVFHHYNVP